MVSSVLIGLSFLRLCHAIGGVFQGFSSALDLGKMAIFKQECAGRCLLCPTRSHSIKHIFLSSTRYQRILSRITVFLCAGGRNATDCCAESHPHSYGLFRETPRFQSPNRMCGVCCGRICTRKAPDANY